MQLLKRIMKTAFQAALVVGLRELKMGNISQPSFSAHTVLLKRGEIIWLISCRAVQTSAENIIQIATLSLYSLYSIRIVESQVLRPNLQACQECALDFSCLACLPVFETSF